MRIEYPRFGGSNLPPWLRLIAAERNIQGIYDILQAIAREQSARSQLIDQ
jgi:hypothetical protein